MASVKPENGTSGFFTTTPLMGVRTLLKPSNNQSLKAYCEDNKDDGLDEKPMKSDAKGVRGMEISGSNGLFGKDDSTGKCSTFSH